MFFELLQVALGNRDRLSRVPAAEEWEEIYEESGRQAVTGILLHGIDRLPAEQRPSQMFLLQWIGEGQIIEQQNLMMDKHCLKLIKKLDDVGLRGSILKGQAIAQLYDKELVALRQSGDIDVYVDCGLKRAMEFAKSTGQKEVEWDYKHLHLNVWDDTEVEMHYRVEVLLNLWKNRRLQKWFHKHQDAIFNDNANLDLNDGSPFPHTRLPVAFHSKSLENQIKNQSRIGEFKNNTGSNTDSSDRTDGMTTPTVEFNVFYILLHIYRHFLYEGVGLRQIVDYYFVLKAISNTNHSNQTNKAQSRIRELENISKANTDCTDKTDYAIAAVSEFGMEKFARGLMWMMKEALEMPAEWMLWEPDKKEGEYILKQVMNGGNFGHYDERLSHGGGKLGAVKAILTHNLHLLAHYPSDVIWAPVWIVWHKLWKITTKMSL